MTPIEKDQIIEWELTQVKEEQTAIDGLPEEVERVLRCIRDHLFDESFDVNEIISCSGARKSIIYSRFRYHIGMHIREYLEDRRMDGAMRLLQHDELKVYEIAFNVGYASYRAFHRAFRRCMGCTPGAYREKMSRENVARKCHLTQGFDGLYPRPGLSKLPKWNRLNRVIEANRIGVFRCRN